MYCIHIYGAQRGHIHCMMIIIMFELDSHLNITILGYMSEKKKKRKQSHIQYNNKVCDK